MDRSAPRDGYDFGNKRQYRRNVWAVAREFINHNRPNAHVLLMPSAEGDEIEVAEANGFRQCNMHIVDRNPAIVATLKKRYPHINTYGVDVVRAVRRIAASDIKLEFANFDFCGTADTVVPVIQQISSIDDAFARLHLAFFTIQRGRDHRTVEFARYIMRNPSKSPVHYDAIQFCAKWNLSASDSIRFAQCFFAFRSKNWISLYYDSAKPRIYKSMAGNLTMMYFAILRDKSTPESRRWWKTRTLRGERKSEGRDIMDSCLANVSLN